MCPQEQITPKSLTETITKVLELVSVQNEKIEHLSKIVEGKASTQSVTQITNTIDTLIADIRQRLEYAEHHHDHSHHEPVPETLQEKLDSGKLVIETSYTVSESAIMMALLREDELILFSIEHTAGLQTLFPIESENPYHSVLHNLMIERGHTDRTPVYITIKSVTTEPINEHSVLVAPVENTIE